MIYALTIAGFDGSAGAGILADIKAMRYFGVYGEAVCTALTEQNEDEFITPGWVIWERIEAQLETLFRKRTFKYVKIGLVEKSKTLRRIVEFIRKKSPDAFIVWDPIASASAGFHFMRDADREEFNPIMEQIDLVTPNLNEFNYLGFKKDDPDLGKKFSLLLKGGHAEGDSSVDILWTKDGRLEFSSPRLPGVDKHGTGCNLSSAILANVALGKSLPDACGAAKDYMDKLLKSGEGRLGLL